MSRYNYFTQTRIETNELKIFIDNLNIDLDPNLLTIIKDYVSKIKQSPTEKKEWLSLDVIIKGNYNPLSVVYLVGDGNNPSGIYLQVLMSKEEIVSCNECDLMSFLNDDNFAYLYDDAELICRVIQYFTINIFDVSLGEVNLIITKKFPFMKVFIWGVIILLVAATIFLFWAWIEFENTEYIIAATLAVASGIWCVRKLLSDPHN
jgi:hypothetical protein